MRGVILVCRHGLFALVLGAMLCAVAWYGQKQMSKTLDADGVASQFNSQGKLRSLTEVVNLTQTLKLVTVEVEATVRANASNTTWRGTATANLSAPVKYLYGVDLSELSQNDFLRDELAKTCLVRIPHPQRLSTEVDHENCQEEVWVTGTRLRSRAGEFYLGQARKAIDQAAVDQVLSADHQSQVDQQTLHQVQSLVGTFIGGDTVVQVDFR